MQEISVLELPANKKPKENKNKTAPKPSVLAAFLCSCVLATVLACSACLVCLSLCTL